MLQAAFVRSPHAPCRDPRHRRRARRASCPASMRCSRSPISRRCCRRSASRCSSAPRSCRPTSRSSCSPRTRSRLSARRWRSSSRRRAISPRTRPRWSRSTTSRCRRCRTAARRLRRARRVAHRRKASNLMHQFRQSYGDVAAAFARAPHRTSVNLKQHRGGAHSIEGRGALAVYDGNEDRLTLWSSTQLAHEVRAFLMTLLRLDENQVRVVAPEVGGGFGAKFVMYPEEVVVAAAALMLRRPVKWIEDRREHFLSAIQERDQYWDLEVAFDDDGRLLGVRGRMIHDEGAYTPQGVNLPFNASTALPGPYILPAYELDVQVVETNKVATMPVRGAGYPEGAFAMERVLDAIADALSARPRRGAAPQSGAGRQDALRHAAEDARGRRHHARQRRLPGLPAARDGRHRLRRLRRAAGAGARGRPLPRHRPRQRHEGHRPRPVRVRHRAHRPLRPHLGLYRRDADGAGHPHGAGADLRRAVRRVAGRRSRWWPATPRSSRTARAALPAGRPSPPAPPCISPRWRCARRRSRSRRICSKQAPTISTCTTAASRSPACRAAA